MLNSANSQPLEQLAPGIKMARLSITDTVSVDYLLVEPASVESEIVHHRTDEVIYLLQGELNAVIGGTKISFREGDCLTIPRGTRHKFTNAGAARAVLLSVCSPPYSADDVEHVG